MDWMPPLGWWTRLRYQQWRVAANATMMNRTIPPAEYYRDLLAMSNSVITEGRHELAVIVAQMACEVLIEQTLTPLLKAPKAARMNFNVRRKDMLKLYTTLTHDRIDNATFWPMHGTHATRRHEVVHRGRRVNPAEAQESLTVATQFVDHVESVRRSLV